MKLLIMEDEVQTREGLESDIPWKDYGIHEVFTAKNGEIGFELAREKRPDIILTDIRMPRMDGISAVKRLRRILPQCSIIFISAYPEKNYFKEAIRLKAVSFVEKPIDMAELNQVVQEAIEEQCRILLQREQEKKAVLYNGQQLVNRLNRNLFGSREECLAELHKAGIDGNAYRLFATIVVQYIKGEDREDENRFSLFCIRNDKLGAEAPARLLTGQKQSDFVVYHVFMKSEREFSKVLSWLVKELEGVRRFYILAGSLQNSFMKFQNSYNDAVLLTNRAFYLPYGTVICENEGDILMTLDFSGWKAEFTESLMRGRLDELPAKLEKYKTDILTHKKIHYTIIREFYLYLYGELCRYMEQNALYLKDSKPGSQAGELFLKNGNYMELHEGVAKIVKGLMAAGCEGEDEFIVRIKKYVSSNYQNPWLSIKEISEAVGKSVSHICVVFKKETGITVNQFLTDVRIEAAKILLNNPRNSIKTVSEECGYTDSSYFTRAFKKHTGQTPSEYRGEDK